MKKKNLLITLGCSYTEGVGCYDSNTIPRDNKNNLLNFHHNADQMMENMVYLKNKDRFHEYGWPRNLQKLLNYDELINLGFGGSSTSGNLKVLFEKYRDIKYSDNYNVLLVWMLPNPIRFSFYRKNVIFNINPSMSLNIYNKYSYNFGVEYVKFIDNIDVDPILEQLFYIKVIEDFCKLRGYHFLFSLTDSHSKKYYEKLYEGNSIMLNGENVIPDVHQNKKIKSLVCDHPNEIGYKLIAETLYHWIKENRSELISTEVPIEFLSKWDGYGLANHTKNRDII
jgi:hypothetical protein